MPVGPIRSHVPTTREARTSSLLDSVPELSGLGDRYELVQELGRGDATVVYLARELASDQLVALKVLGGGDQRFARDAGIVTTMTHPNLVRVLRVEAVGMTPVAIVYEYVAGESLRARLARDHALPVTEVVRILRDVAAGLAHAHGRGIVHGRVKPENVLLEEYGGPALLTDLPVAGPPDAWRPTGGEAGRDAPYVAPERFTGAGATPAGDVYALGVVAWEMLAGRQPAPGALPSLRALRPEVPPFLLHAVDRATHAAPQLRWRDAGELLASLTPGGARAAPAARPAVLSLPPSTRRRARRRRWPLVAALATLPVAAGAWFLATRSATPGAPVEQAVERVAERPVERPVERAAAPAAPAVPEPPSVHVEAAGRVDLPRTDPPVSPGDPCESAAADDQRACVASRLVRFDAPMKRAYAALVADLRGRGDRAAESTLVAEQSAWLDTRERECAAAVPETARNRWVDARVRCLALRAAERGGQLQARRGR